MTRFIREERLKNVREPVRIYEVPKSNGEYSTETLCNLSDKQHRHSPLINMSNDPNRIISAMVSRKKL